jgi:proteasome lid subunit RPN8/RPN11
MDESGVRERIDIAQVKEQALPDGVFPAAYPQADFRVYFAPEAHRHILAHSRTDTRIELCGVMVGRILKDAFGPFALVDDIIRGDHAENQGAQVTFTQQTWAHIFAEMDRSHSGQKIIGWYHTHPGFGIFLSPMDMFIQEHFFNLPSQTAFVVDPLSGDEGLFQWRNGKVVPAPQYWVGPDIHVSHQRVSRRPAEAASEATERKVSPVPDIVVRAREADLPAPAARTRSVAWDIVMVVLLSCILLLVALHFFVGPWDKVQEKVKSRWQTWHEARMGARP